MEIYICELLVQRFRASVASKRVSVACCSHLDSVRWFLCLELLFAVVCLFLVGCSRGNLQATNITAQETALWNADAEQRQLEGSFDIFGTICLLFALIALILGSQFATEDYTWTQPALFGPFAATGALVYIFVLIELQTPGLPLVPFKLLSGESNWLLYATVLLNMVPMNAVRECQHSSRDQRLTAPCSFVIWHHIIAASQDGGQPLPEGSSSSS
jgi:hypothetical protein